MTTLDDALTDQQAFPHGLFWFVRQGEEPSPMVIDLLTRVQSNGSQAALVAVQTFDELMADLFLTHQDSLSDVRDYTPPRQLGAHWGSLMWFRSPSAAASE
jgi:hypothetical protein